MLNRRFLRIKAFQALYSFFQEEQGDTAAYRRRLVESLGKTYDLYLFMLLFPVELKHYIEAEIEVQQAKFLKSEETIHSLTALLNNKVIACIEHNVAFNEKVKKVKARWSNSNEFFKNILAELRNHPAIIAYGTSHETQLPRTTR